MKYTFLLLLGILGWGIQTGVLAQGYSNTKKVVTYNMSLPLGSTRDFISRYSFRGASVELRQMFEENFSLGGVVGWHVLNRAAYGTYTEGTVSISGKEYKTVNSVPIMLTAHKYYGAEEKSRPYIGLGLGAQYVARAMDLGNYTFTDKKWHLGIAPEAGYIFPVTENFSILAGARWQYAFKNGNSPGYSYLNFNVGLMF